MASAMQMFVVSICIGFIVGLVGLVNDGHSTIGYVTTYTNNYNNRVGNTSGIITTSDYKQEAQQAQGSVITQLFDNIKSMSSLLYVATMGIIPISSLAIPSETSVEVILNIIVCFIRSIFIFQIVLKAIGVGRGTESTG